MSAGNYVNISERCMVVKGPIIEVILVFKQVTKHSINEMRNSFASI